MADSRISRFSSLFQVAKFSPNSKFVIGLILLVSCFCLYIIYESTKIVTLIPVGLTIFPVAIYFMVSRLKFLKPYRQQLTFIAAATSVLLFLGGWDLAMDRALDKSPYVVQVELVEAKFTVLILNALGIHATQGGHDILLPSDSKIQSITILAGCTGLQSLVLFLAIFGVMLIDFRRKVSSKKLIGLFLIGISSVLCANFLRIPLLAYVAYAFGNDTLNIVHPYAATPFFMGAIGLFWILATRLISDNSKVTGKLAVRDLLGSSTE